MARDDHAILVGIDRYPGFADLEGAENDAVAFREWLVNSAGGDVDPENVQTIVSSQFPKPVSLDDAQPVVSSIDSAFSRIITAGRRQPEPLGRRLYIFLAGHGFTVEYASPKLLTAEAHPDATGFHIPGIEYADWFRRAAMFREVVLLMDCCAEPRPFAPARMPPWDPLIRTGVSVSHLYAFAARYGERSRERKIERYGRVHGVFTAALLEGLRGAAAIRSAVIRGSDLEAFVVNYLPQLCGVDDYAEPRFDYEVRADIPLVQGIATPLADVRVHVAGAWPGVVMTTGYGSAVELEFVQNRRYWHATVGPGLYSVRYTDGNRQEPRVIEVIGPGGLDVTLD